MEKYGLSSDQVKASKEKHGDNRITEVASEGFWDKFLGNLGDPMIKILCVALVINVIFVFLGQTEWFEALAIAIAVLIATLVSTIAEYKNENAFQKLQEDASQIVCKAYRDGQITQVLIDDLVVGDYVLLQPGDKIPADGILFNGELGVDQAILNGETQEARKIPMPEGHEDSESGLDFLNEYKVFRGSVVCNGNAIMIVTTVGDKSVYGQIASELQQDDDRDTPLKVKLRKLAEDISKFGYIGGIGIALAFLFQRIVIQNDFDMALITAYVSNWMVLINDIIYAVKFAVIIIIMAVPEGLPLMIAIVSSLNMRKMLKNNVLVRKLVGIETAGSLNILFSDKTGTITKGELEAITFISGGGTEFSTLDKVGEKLKEMLSISIHSNTSAHMGKSGDVVKAIGGNATERAILNFALLRTPTVNVSITNTIPFNSNNKYSASQINGDYNLTLVKGAPEKILERCTHYYDEDGQVVPLTDLSAINDKIDEMASRAIRVLALATTGKEIDGAHLPEWNDGVLVGIIGIRDEIRPESVSAIQQVHSAGVQVVMITGDRMETASAIAKEAGLLKSDTDIAMTSDELAKLSDDELKKMLKDIRVIARALPSDKSRLVRIAQDLNLVVGMTGDGVNDSPALKAADVGLAMGSGTEVAKEASEIIILDDNFNSIDQAILYGRTIFNTIRKFITFQLTINLAAVAISFIAPLLGMNPPLTIIQILWLNLVMDSLGALAFGAEPARRRYMQEKPKDRNENIISSYMKSSIGIGSLVVFGLSLFFLLSDIPRTIFRYAPDDRYLMTGFFAFFVFIYVFNAFNIRTEKLNLFENIGKNKGFLAIIGLIATIQLLMTFLGGPVLRTYGLVWNEMLFVMGLAFIIIPVDLLRKVIFNATARS
ncbi:MAG: calcium-translocating P-type ATPase, PMCA-type [Defluviitaleaceae bacterium]|nr:calcium-translocating P-type ATPase, PMCA-type [Defluviitaleaceae bacterium]